MQPRTFFDNISRWYTEVESSEPAALAASAQGPSVRQEAVAHGKQRRILIRTVGMSWIIVCFTVLVLLAAVIPYQRNLLLAEMRQRAMVAYTSTAQVAVESIILDDYSTVVEHCLNMVAKNPTLEYVVLTRQDGFSLVHMRDSWRQETLSGRWRPAGSDGERQERFMRNPLGSGEVLHLSYPFAYKGIYWGWIHLGLSTVKFHQDTRALYGRSGLIAALAVSVGFVAALLHARRLSIPILELERFARKIASGDLSGRIEIRTGDELEQLAESFNFMVTELQRSKHEREIAQHKLVDAARQAGMAEVAIDVLHNVGNVLNSVGVTTSAVTKRMRQSKTAALASVAELVTSRGDNLATYLRDDPSGRKLPEYLTALCAHLAEEQQDVLAHMLALEHHIQHMRDIIHLQQNYSRAIGFTEPVRIHEVVEDALQLNAESNAQYDIAVIKQYEGVPVCLLDRHRLLQILTNLISNAQHALRQTQGGQRAITIRIGHARPERLCIEVADTGHGISPENMTRIFQHGFTTRRNGHGFGLHGSAMAAKEMNGELTADSEGPGHGATFRLILPCRSVEMTT